MPLTALYLRITNILTVSLWAVSRRSPELRRKILSLLEETYHPPVASLLVYCVSFNLHPHHLSYCCITPHAKYIPIWLTITALAQKVCYVRRNQSISRHWMTPEIYKTNNGRLKLEPESIEGIMQVTGYWKAIAFLLWYNKKRIHRASIAMTCGMEKGCKHITRTQS